MTTTKPPTVSVIVPAYNAEIDLAKCLGALADSTLTPAELFVVDDGSTDGTADVAESFGATVIPSQRPQSGPGAARNLAAATARGDVLVFVDADVVVNTDTMARMVAPFAADPKLGALFGSYDDSPADAGFLSQYKNLQHHYVHQTAERDAATFWAGCGAVRRAAFVEAGGFDGGRYGVPSIEDIELGYRLREHGWTIRLDPDIQVCHLKRWTFGRLLHTEIFCRALPWSELLLARGNVPRDLNLRWSDRLSAVAAWLLVLSLPLTVFGGAASIVAAGAASFLVLANRPFYAFLARRHGVAFALRALPVHWLYFLYSSACFGLCWLRRALTPRARRTANP